MTKKQAASLMVFIYSIAVIAVGYLEGENYMLIIGAVLCILSVVFLMEAAE